MNTTIGYIRCYGTTATGFEYNRENSGLTFNMNPQDAVLQLQSLSPSMSGSITCDLRFNQTSFNFTLAVTYNITVKDIETERVKLKYTRDNSEKTLNCSSKGILGYSSENCTWKIHNENRSLISTVNTTNFIKDQNQCQLEIDWATLSSYGKRRLIYECAINVHDVLENPIKYDIELYEEHVNGKSDEQSTERPEPVLDFGFPVNYIYYIVGGVGFVAVISVVVKYTVFKKTTVQISGPKNDISPKPATDKGVPVVVLAPPRKADKKKDQSCHIEATEEYHYWDIDQCNETLKMTQTLPRISEKPSPEPFRTLGKNSSKAFLSELSRTIEKGSAGSRIYTRTPTPAHKLRQDAKVEESSVYKTSLPTRVIDDASLRKNGKIPPPVKPKPTLKELKMTKDSGLPENILAEKASSTLPSKMQQNSTFTGGKIPITFKPNFKNDPNTLGPLKAPALPMLVLEGATPTNFPLKKSALASRNGSIASDEYDNYYNDETEQTYSTLPEAHFTDDDTDEFDHYDVMESPIRDNRPVSKVYQDVEEFNGKPAGDTGPFNYFKDTKSPNVCDNRPISNEYQDVGEFNNPSEPDTNEFDYFDDIDSPRDNRPVSNIYENPEELRHVSEIEDYDEVESTNIYDIPPDFQRQSSNEYEDLDELLSAVKIGDRGNMNY